MNPAHQQVSVLPLSSGRYQVMWYDATGHRRKATRNDKGAAEALRRELLAERRAHEEGRFTVDDRQVYTLARSLVEHHGYILLQAMQEWAKGKGSTEAVTFGQAVDAFLASRGNLAVAHVKKLKSDLAKMREFIGPERPAEVDPTPHQKNPSPRAPARRSKPPQNSKSKPTRRLTRARAARKVRPATSSNGAGSIIWPTFS